MQKQYTYATAVRLDISCDFLVVGDQSASNCGCDGIRRDVSQARAQGQVLLFARGRRQNLPRELIARQNDDSFGSHGYGTLVVEKQ